MSLEIIVYVVVQLLLLGFAKIEFKLGSRRDGKKLILLSILISIVFAFIECYRGRVI